MTQIGNHDDAYRSTPLEQKLAWFQNAPGLSAVEPARQFMTGAAALYTDSDAQVRATMRGLGADWTGAAATNAGATLQRAADWSKDAGAGHAAGGETVEGYGRSFESVRGQIHWEDPWAWGWNDTASAAASVATLNPVPFLGNLTTDYFATAQQNRTNDATAIVALQAHEKQTRAAVDTFPSIAPAGIGPRPDPPNPVDNPPSTPVAAAGVGAATGGAAAGLVPVGAGIHGSVVGGAGAGGGVGPGGVSGVGGAGVGGSGGGAGGGGGGGGGAGGGGAGAGSAGAGGGGGGAGGGGAAGGTDGAGGGAGGENGSGVGPGGLIPGGTGVGGGAGDGGAPPDGRADPGSRVGADPGGRLGGTNPGGTGGEVSGADPRLRGGLGPGGAVGTRDGGPFRLPTGAPLPGDEAGRLGVGGGGGTAGGWRDVVARPPSEPGLISRGPTAGPEFAARLPSGAPIGGAAGEGAGMPFMGGMGGGAGAHSTEHRNTYWIRSAEPFDVPLPPHSEGVIHGGGA